MAAASPASVATGFGAMPAGGVGGGGIGGARGRFGNLAKDGYFGRGGVASRFDGLQQLSDSLATDAKSPLGDLDFAVAALSPAGGKLAEAAQKRWGTAAGKEPPKDRAELRALLVEACLLDSAAANVGATDGSVAQQAIEKLEELHQQDVKDAAVKLPALQTKLDLVIRDQSLAEALAQVAQAAKIDIKMTDGSVADATELASGIEPRVSYLDLRHATVAQALDWILQPARLTWSASDKGIVAGADRRLAGKSGWIYDVSVIALPSGEELATLDYEKGVAVAGESAEKFLAAIRAELKATDENGVLWFGPGELLVLGTPKTHASVGKAIGTLRVGTDKPAGPLGALAAVTRKRYAAQKEKFAKAQAAQELYDTAVALDQFSWQLLAAAAAGQTDLEALTELQIAWKSPQAKELLGTPGRSLALRSLWSIASAARSLPKDAELAALAAQARKLALPVLADARAAAEKDRNDIAAVSGVLYASLAEPQDADLLAKALPLFAAKTDDQGPAADVRTLARVLVGKSAAGDDAALVAMLQREPTSVDHVALMAVACHRAGGDAWQQFRAVSRDLVGKHPLPGELVVLVNRLAESRLQLALAK
jgi:hypothetical protein